jgi:hypothetical protein
MTEQWIKWEPIKDLQGSYYLESIADGKEEFIIYLMNKENKYKKIKVSFGDSVDSYRSTYESFRQKDIHDIQEKYGVDFCVEWTFFKVENSAYLQWLSEQSYSITQSLPLHHFVFITLNFFVDVIATCEPKIELI